MAKIAGLGNSAPKPRKVRRTKPAPKPPAGPRDAIYAAPRTPLPKAKPGGQPAPRSEAAAGGGYRLPRKVVRHTQPPPKSEIAAAGGVDTQRVAAFKRTPEYRSAARAAAQAERSQLAARFTHHGPPRTISAPVVRVDGHAYEKVTRPTGGLFGGTHTTYRPLGQSIEYTPLKGNPLYRESGVNSAIVKATAPVLHDYRDLTIGTIPMVAHEAGNVIHGHPGRVVSDFVTPYKQLAEHPLRMLKQHPLATVVMLAGAKSAIGRGGGAAARTGALGADVKAAAATERPAAVAEGTLMSEPRRYSPDVISKAAQVGVEKAKVRRVRRLTRKGDQLERQGRPAQAQVVREKAARAVPGRMSEQQMQHRADELVDVNEVVRRRHAAQLDEAVHHATRNTEPGMTRNVRRAQETKPTAAVSLVAQNITAATPEDLAAFRDELAHQYEHGDLTNAQKAQNRDVRQQVQQAIDAHPDMTRVAGAAQRYQAIVHDLTGKLAAYDMIDPQVAARRAELPFAVRNMGAVRDTTPRMTATGVEKFVSKEERKLADKRVKKVRRREAKAKQTLDQTVADARVLAAQDSGGVPTETQPPRIATSARRASTSSDVRAMLRDIEQAQSRPLGYSSRRVVSRTPMREAPADRVLRAVSGYDEARAERIRAEEQAAQAKARHVAAKKAGRGQPDRQAPGFVDEQGRPLTTEQIAAERRDTPGMVGEPAYVSHAPNLRRPGSFYREASRPVKAEDRAFTGEAQRKGTLDVSPEGLHANARKLQTLADAHEGWMRYLTEAGLRGKDGQLVTGTRGDVEKAIGGVQFDAKGNPIPGAYGWRVVRLNPWGGRREQLQTLIEHVNDLPDHQAGHPLIDSLHDALDGKGDGEFAAIPEAVAHRIDQHLRVLGSTPGHVWNALISLWRKNVLSTSPKWAAGNIVEAFVRSAIYGVRPGDRAKFNRVLDELAKTDPQAAERLRAQLGEGHYGFTARNQRYTTTQELADPARHSRVTVELSRLLGAANRTPVLNWLPRAFNAWTQVVFTDMARVETQFRFAMAGRHLRATVDEVGLGRLSEQAARDAAQGLRETKSQVEMARAVRRAYGQYEAFNPGMRRAMALYTPFVAWSWNAIKFLGSVLPKDHPVLLGLLAAANQSSEEWLRAQGQRADRLDALPPWLLGSVITGKGAYRVGRYTPFGLASDPLGSAAGLVMPAFSDTLLAARGLDPFGQPLKTSKAQALMESVLGFVPFSQPIIGTARRKGSLAGKLNQQLNPLEPTPISQVRYARVKAELDRIQQRIDAMSRAGKAKRPDGSNTPEYQHLLDLKVDVSQRRAELLSEAGIKPDPTLAIERELIPLRRQERHMLDGPGGGVDQYGFATKELQDLRDRIAGLEDQKRAAAPKKRARRVKPRPKTPRQQILDETRRLRQSSTPRAIRKELQDEINRLREQAKIAHGG